MKRWLRRIGRIVGVLLVVLLGLNIALRPFTGTSHWARTLVWFESDVDDYRRFPARAVRTAPPVFEFRQPTEEQAARYAPVFERILNQPFDEFLACNDTSAFIVIKDDILLYEGYFNGYGRESTVTSFSVAKSFASTLVGIAIDQGYINSIEDPITQYVPELLERDPRYANITLRHLLTMSSGIRYVERGLPWSDDALTYYHPDLRAIAISSPIAGPPGEAFHYNNYHPLLLGLVLERATGRPVAQYLEETIWRPLGMEADGSWSLDSERSGFEKMESGINGRAIDFLKFGRLFLRRGDWDGTRVVSEQWVDRATRLDTTTDPAPHYQFMWWVNTATDAPHDYYAAGKHGQYIYVSPRNNVVMVRFGRTISRPTWNDVFSATAEQLHD